MHLQNILTQHKATSEEKIEVVKYFEKRTVSHSAVVEKLKDIRKPVINWVDFSDEDKIRETLKGFSSKAKPLFGQMNGQQMIEHLSNITQIANGNWKIDAYVSDEKANRRKPFLNTDNEIQVGFKASYLSETPSDLKFKSIEEAIDDLINQVKIFEKVFKEDESRVISHPFFGELNEDLWAKFQVKHFTHHFKQFGLI